MRSSIEKADSHLELLPGGGQDENEMKRYTSNLPGKFEI